MATLKNQSDYIPRLRDPIIIIQLFLSTTLLVLEVSTTEIKRNMINNMSSVRRNNITADLKLHTISDSEINSGSAAVSVTLTSPL